MAMKIDGISDLKWKYIVALFIMSGLWKKYEEKIKAKRDVNNKRKNASNGTQGKKIRLQSDELTVQRLSSSVEGKAQKYSRIGPREFIPYKNSDITIDGIKQACLIHFQSKGHIGKGMEVDILAGERGPTCTSLHQIPDLKLIHVRFIPRVVEVDKVGLSMRSLGPSKGVSSSISLSTRDNHSRYAKSAESPPKSSTAKRSQTFPKSLSLSTMLNLGRVVKTPSDLTVIDVSTFHVDNLTWTLIPDKAEFLIESTHFGEGGFRRAYKATSPTPKFGKKDWVIKKYLPSTLETIEKTNQTIESYTKKTVQTHVLAQSFANQLQAKFDEVEYLEPMKLFLYNNIFMGKIEATGEHVITLLW